MSEHNDPTRASRGPGQPPANAPDDDIGRLVRDVAASWRPPVEPARLGVAGWQARVERRRGVGGPFRRVFGGPFRRVFGRSPARPVFAAVLTAGAAVLALALVAVWLNERPARNSAAGPTVSSSAQSAATGSPGPSGSVHASQKLALFGGPAPALRPLIAGYPADQLVDLTTGVLVTLAPAGPNGRSNLFRRADGSFVAVTVDVHQAAGVRTSGVDSAAVALRHYDPQARLRSSRAVLSYASAAWRPAGPDSPAGVSVEVSFDRNADLLFVGWVTRAASTWDAGIDVVDAASGAIVQRLGLPATPAAAGGQEEDAWPVQVFASPDDRHVVASGSISLGGVTSLERWIAPLARGRIGSLVKLAAASTSGCEGVAAEGFATSTVYYTVCSGGVSPVLRRLDLNGTVLGDTPLPDQAIFAGPPPVDTSAGVIYDWDPIGRTLIRLDAATGRETGRVTAPAPAAVGDDPLAGLRAAIGRWIAPPVAAKMYMWPAAALSPDGGTLYALGGAGTATAPTGSQGVFVFDVHAMRFEAHWPPTADFNSVAVSADGRYVLACAQPGVDASGAQTDQQASISVFDAATGRLRVVAGELGSGNMLTFASGDRP